MHFSQALGNRLEGQVSFLLGDELEGVVEAGLQAAKKLADRIGELRGAVTADPALLVERSPLPEFSLPESNSEMGVTLGHVLERVRIIIGEYGAFLEEGRGRDELSHRLVPPWQLDAYPHAPALRERRVRSATAGRPKPTRSSGRGPWPAGANLGPVVDQVS
jgi:hypothetical protein